MIVKKLATSNIFHKVRQLESLSKTNLFANSCRLPQFGRTSSTLANPKQCLYSNVMNNGTKQCLSKLPITGTVGLQLSRNASNINSDHVRLWVLEKLVSAALPVVIPAALLMENAVLDGIMSVLVVMHTYWGFEAIITDYARPSVIGNILPKVLHLSLFLLAAVTLCGLFVLINDGPGVSRVIKDFWAIGKKPQKEEPAPAPALTE